MNTLSLGWLLRYAELEVRLNTCILVEERDDLVPLSLDIPFEFSTSNRQVVKQIFDRDGGSPLSGHDRCALELARSFKGEL